MALGARRQRGHCQACRLITRQEGKGSPQVSQTGGIIVRAPTQQVAQTGPRMGSSSSPPQAAQRAARRIDRRASVSRGRTALVFVRDLDAFGITPEALERIEDAGLRSEHVHDEVEEIHQHPFGSLRAFDVRRFQPRLQ